MTEETDEKLSVRQAAEVLGVSHDTVMRLVKRGRIPAERPSPHITRIRRKDLRRYAREMNESLTATEE